MQANPGPTVSLPAANADARVLEATLGNVVRGIELGQTQPVDGAVASDQSRRMAIANQRVVFDELWHAPTAD